MNVCGVLVYVLPTRRGGVMRDLSTMDGVEVHDVADDGRLVVTVEDTDSSAAIDTLSAVHKLRGVVAATLVYHQFEPAAE